MAVKKRRLSTADTVMIGATIILMLTVAVFMMKDGMVDARVHRTLALRFQAMARVFGQCGMACEQRYLGIMNAERMN